VRIDQRGGSVWDITLLRFPKGIVALILHLSLAHSLCLRLLNGIDRARQPMHAPFVVGHICLKFFDIEAKYSRAQGFILERCFARMPLSNSCVPVFLLGVVEAHCT